MTKKIFLLGLLSGILAGTFSYGYARIYNAALGTDFSKVVSVAAIFSACIFGNTLMATGYWLLNRWIPNKTEIIFNSILITISFLSILGPFSTQLPLDIEAPELFPGLTVPMHFFPLLIWLTLRPVFISTTSIQDNFEL